MYTAAVITVSDKGSAGEREDSGGPLVCKMLENAGYTVVHTEIVPDEQKLIERELIRCSDELDIALVVTTGGTGFSPRDVTPEATIAVCERMAPGIPEAMRAESQDNKPGNTRKTASRHTRQHAYNKPARQPKSRRREPISRAAGIGPWNRNAAR